MFHFLFPPLFSTLSPSLSLWWELLNHLYISLPKSEQPLPYITKVHQRE